MRGPSRRRCLVAILALWVSAPDERAARAEPEITPKEVAAVRAGERVKLDGLLDDEVWQGAAVITGVTRVEPIEDGRPGFGRSEFRILYDDESLYIGARVWQPADALRAHVGPRDDLGNDDSVNLYIKPIEASDVGYLFRINPLGIQRDAIAVGYTTVVPSWDAVWDSVGVPLEDGYSIEIRMPFRIFRFTRARIQSWGIGFGVYTGSIGETAVWPPYSSNRGSQLAQLGTLTGMTDLKRSLGLKLIPTLVARLASTADSRTSLTVTEEPWVSLRQPSILDPGLDVQIGLTAGSTLNLTVNPDFSQIEADADQLVYDIRYPLSLQEKRPFFLEGFNAFDTPLPLLYSRAINHPAAGLKIAGNLQRLSIGLLSTLDLEPLPTRITFDPSRTDVPVTGFEDVTGKDALTSAARLDYAVTGNGHVGIFVADKEIVTRDRDRAAGNVLGALDARVNFAGVYYATVQAGASQTRDLVAGGPALQGGVGYLDLKRDGRRLLVDLESVYLADAFRAEASDLKRTGYASSALRLAYKLEIDRGFLSYLRPEVTGTGLADARTRSLLDRSVVPGLTIQMARNTSLSGTYSRGEESFNNKRVPLERASVSLASAPASWLTGQVTLTAGDRINYDPADDFVGTSYDGTAGLTLRPTSGTQIDGTYTKGLFYRPDGSRKDDVDLVLLRILHSFTSRWSVRLLAQLNTYTDAVQGGLLLSYVYRPGTVVYLGYQDNEALDPAVMPRIDRRVFLKLSYLIWR